MPVNRDAIGSLGEDIVSKLLSRFHGRDEPLFLPRFLGEKYPAIDFFVALNGAGENQTPYFVAQVKTTMLGYTKFGQRLMVRVDQADMRRLVSYPAPTYVIGVDGIREEGFILGATLGGATSLSTVPTTHALSQFTTLQALYDEVRDFWAAYPARFTNSRFT